MQEVYLRGTVGISAVVPLEAQASTGMHGVVSGNARFIRNVQLNTDASLAPYADPEPTAPISEISPHNAYIPLLYLERPARHLLSVAKSWSRLNVDRVKTRKAAPQGTVGFLLVDVAMKR